MGQLQWTPVAASWHLLSQPPLFTAHVSAWEGDRKAGVRCSKGWGSYAMQMSPMAQPGSGSGYKPPCRALGSHTTATRPQSREIMNTWGLVSPTDRASRRPPCSSKEEEFNFPGTKSEEHLCKSSQTQVLPGVPRLQLPRSWGHSPSPPVGWQGGPVPLAATKLPSHKNTGDPVPAVPDHHPLLRHGGWSSVSG